MRSGFSIAECMLTGSLICLLALVSFEGIIAASRIVHENSEFLAADALAWDVAWKRFNESPSELQSVQRPWTNPVVDQDVTSRGRDQSAAPALWYGANNPVQVYSVITNAADGLGVMIHVNVEWGPAGHRRALSPVSGKRLKHFNHDIGVYRSKLERGG